MKKIEEMTVEELRARRAEIRTELEKPDADLDALEQEAAAISERMQVFEKEERRKGIAQAVAEGAGEQRENPMKEDARTVRANEFVKTHRMSVKVEETRALLVSGGKLATPTEVSGINDKQGAKYSSIVDMVSIVDCGGMGKNRVAYEKKEAEAADAQTEGQSATTKEGEFGYIDIAPTSVAVLAQISKQAKKQSPLNYAGKVQEHAVGSLRKKTSALIIEAMKASALNTTIDATVTGGKGVIDEKTLRKITLNYGGDESVIGNAVLFLNKNDLIAFGDIRGTNEKKAVYEINPDPENPNTGIIKDGGLSVRYCLNNNLTACSGTAQQASSGEDVLTMCYGNPKCFELDLFSDYEIAVSEDFAFDKLMDTIRGDVELGGDVVVQDGFVFVKIPKKTA
ncbi:phage major capsid protein [Laedolimicola ammoniilytica]|uniref:Phage major capsid protein n=1 Tax=Laedolimicola ammoniilytica TaxID=2981771 RepID=A0ABT2RYM8_9FIRM|nr:phage major capsid protein [Laedolimicola ammoniilytica]MCU6697272.1 phage major capsid protein [Laedolimicola ammoniilytica]SCI17977.1 phage major capsid protein%2C HK97 family [uncultured Clostridium sp.]